ncbi:YlbL family protein [Tamaricihabitans halophyticus]|uniref:YlbL family protein n=1 Tax=Tamaricihabitans halophyticus TaxID=1262583 RepID=UPI001FB4F015|nr:PDZ domain-containing protein [Tamaricihabitans halophyticus]
MTARSKDQPQDDPQRAAPRRERRLTRRGWTVLLSFVLLLAFGLLGAFVRVPYVGLGPGPTFDTLGESEGVPVVTVQGPVRTYETSGELRMTTVSLSDEVTLFGALGMWASGRYALDPREQYFKPGQTQEEVEQENTEQFQSSQGQAETAALRELGKPVKVYADQVVRDGPAADAIEAGDELVEVHGSQIDEAADVVKALEDTKPGDRVSLTVRTDGQQERTISVRLAERPEDIGGDFGYLGLTPVDRADVNFDISIKLEDIGGPSAGLMFALAIMDRLQPEDLVDGKHVAGTGEINSAGKVGEIGGISFKLVAAREAGAEAFLVPAGNCAEAKGNAPDGLELIKVGNLGEAVDALAALRAGDPIPKC